MKSLIFFSLLFTTFAFSQQKWVSDNAHWTYHYFSVAQHGFLTVEEVNELTIQGEVCKGYETTIHTFIMNQFGDTVALSPEVLDTNYVYYANDTVHMLYENNFHPIYIFNLNENDVYTTLVDTNVSQCTNTSTIHITDSTSVQISGQNYLQYTLDSDENDSYRIKGDVNARFGHFDTDYNQYSFVFPLVYMCFDVEHIDESPSFSFRCFQDDDLSYSANPGEDCIYPYNLVGLDSEFKLDLKLTNPVTQGEIQLPQTLENATTILTNLAGKIIVKSSALSLEVSHLENGMYIISIEKDGAVYTEKLLIKN